MKVSISMDKQSVTIMAKGHHVQLKAFFKKYFDMSDGNFSFSAKTTVTMRRDKTHCGGITDYFEGATIKNLVINGNMIKNGQEYYYEGESGQAAKSGYSDEQIATALTRINGKGRAIDSKMKWAGAHWLLRWECNFPTRAKEFCKRVGELPLANHWP